MTNPSSMRWLYITCRNTEEAFSIGKQLVTERLAACANVISGMISIFEWNGEIVEEEEAILILKSTESLYADIEKTVKAIHSYETPCILSLPITDGNPDYIQWILQNTRKRGV